MNRQRWWMRALALATLSLAAALPLGAQNQARFQELSGKVEVSAAGGAWRPAEVGLAIDTGTTVSTGFNSEAVLDLGTSVLRVRPLTRLRLDELIRREDTASTSLYLRVGKVQAEIKTTEGLRQDFTLKSPVSTAAVRGTIFDFDGINLQVQQGLVSFTNQLGQGGTVGGGEGGSIDDGQGDPDLGEGQKESNSTVIPYTAPTGGGITLPPTTGSLTVRWTFSEEQG